MMYKSEEEVVGGNNPSDSVALEYTMATIHTQNHHSIKVVDYFTIWGGSLPSFSDELYFEDAIDLNSKWYCDIFTTYDAQAVLSRTHAAVDCNSLYFEVYGFEQDYDNKNKEKSIDERDTNGGGRYVICH